MPPLMLTFGGRESVNRPSLAVGSHAPQFSASDFRAEHEEHGGA
jgi:hypothetical protein